MNNWIYTIEKAENGYIIGQRNEDLGRVERYVYNKWEDVVHFLNPEFNEVANDQ